MKLKDIKISILVKLGFGILLFFVIMLGVISHLQTDKIHQQTEIMYNHPLIVRRALDTLKTDVLNMRMASKDFVFAVTDKERHDANQLMALSATNVLGQFNLLREAYLGPHTDVEEAYEAFEMWRTAREEYNELKLSEQSPPRENDSGASTVKLSVLREQLVDSIKKIDDFAKNKSDTLLIAANKLFHSLTRQLILLVVIIVFLSFITIYILLRNIRIPLDELTYATQNFHNGDMDARSSYESKNKFGELSASFNILAEDIQTNTNKMIYQNRELEAQKTELRILSNQLMSVEERERKRIASDIHDSIGQALSAIKYSVEGSLSSINESDSPAFEQLKNIIPLTQQSIEEVRRIIMDLRPTILDDLGLLATISWLCREYESIYTNIRIDKEIHLEEADISATLKTVIYRILQEALNNAAKHSRADSIRLHLIKSKDELEFMVEDTGLGFKMDDMPSMNAEKEGIGLLSMRERAQLSGGNFTIQSTPGVGTRILVSWPMKAYGVDQE